MSDPLYLAAPDQVAGLQVGDSFTLAGEEGRHAATVKRARVGETVLVGDGAGRGVRVMVTSVASGALTGDVVEVVDEPASPWRWQVVQGLAKGDRADLSVEILTEVGVDLVAAWQSRRSIVKWDAKADKALAKWRATAREAAKQSRRLRMPEVHPEVVTPKNLASTLTEFEGLVLVAHEAATARLGDVALPASGSVTVLVGPEGGIAPEELDDLVALGAQPVLIADHVLRASTAGAVALAQLQLMARQQHPGEGAGRD